MTYSDKHLIPGYHLQSRIQQFYLTQKCAENDFQKFTAGFTGQGLIIPKTAAAVLFLHPHVTLNSSDMILKMLEEAWLNEEEIVVLRNCFNRVHLQSV